MTKNYRNKPREVGIGKRILALSAEGLTPYAIACVVERSAGQVYRTLWAARNPERCRANNKKWAAKRYGSDEYRKQNAEYVRNRYHNDPDFRSARIAAVERSRAKREAHAS